MAGTVLSKLCLGHLPVWVVPSQIALPFSLVTGVHATDAHGDSCSEVVSMLMPPAMGNAAPMPCSPFERQTSAAGSLHVIAAGLRAVHVCLPAQTEAPRCDSKALMQHNGVHLTPICSRIHKGNLTLILPQCPCCSMTRWTAAC